MVDFIHAHQMGIINGVCWIISLAAGHWLSVTDKVAAANFLELIVAAYNALKKKDVPK
jgi:hypothetical protein